MAHQLLWLDPLDQELEDDPEVELDPPDQELEDEPEDRLGDDPEAPDREAWLNTSRTTTPAVTALEVQSRRAAAAAAARRRSASIRCWRRSASRWASRCAVRADRSAASAIWMARSYSWAFSARSAWCSSA